MKTKYLLHLSRRSRMAVIMAALATLPIMGKAQVTISQGRKPLSAVVNTIQKQTKCKFFYNDDLATQSIQCTHLKNVSLQTALQTLFGRTNISYTVDGQNVYLKQNTTQTASPRNTPQQRQQKKETVKGNVKDQLNEPLVGVTVTVQGTNERVVTDIDGNYTITTNVARPVLVFSYIGLKDELVAVNGRSHINVTMSEDQSVLNEVVVTAMGIQRKEKSLTYATQQIKAEELMRVEDPNVANMLEGKISGVTITQSAGGAGGASKILLRGNKSILGSSTPLIVVDGVPMSNDTRGQMGRDGSTLTYQGTSEGSDPLSMINPDDIESMNVLKGANAAALYGSKAANGVIMITTKKGKAGKYSVTFSSNVTMDTPLITPEIQNIYGATVSGLGNMSVDSWGPRIDSRTDEQLKVSQNMGPKFNNATQDVYLRNKAHNDVDDFFRTGVTTNNSVSVSGGTDVMRTYLSLANSHATGMLQNNSYNRNTVAFRQSYRLFKRLNVEASINYVQTVTRNRPGGGTVLNPIYHLYLAPRNIDMNYYRHNYTREGAWQSELQSYFSKNSDGGYSLVSTQVPLKGIMQNWAYMEGAQNNPYWLLHQNGGKQNTDRVYGYVSGVLDIVDGLTLQARVSIDHTQYRADSRRYATTFLPAGMDDYGHFWRDLDRTNEIYTDYLLSYNKTLSSQWAISATAGYVGHVVKQHSQHTDVVATYVDGSRTSLSDRINLFETNSGGTGATWSGRNTNWDQAALFTAQVGWRDAVFVDASYRQDWYRAFKQFSARGMATNYGYFGMGANAIVSQLVKMPSWVSYFKYRLSYSEVGNSIPNIVFSKGSVDYRTGAVTPSIYSQFAHPKPEKTSSFETGFEASFFGSRLDWDFTYYHAVSSNQYMVGTNASGKAEPINSGKVRNAGIETTIGLNTRWGKDWKWRTAYNLSYNDNKILETTYNPDGTEKLVAQDIAGVRVRYNKGGSYGDMYVTDYKRNDDGSIVTTQDGRVQFETASDKLYAKYVGNMNAKWQMGWNNTISWRDLTLSFLINGRIGGKVISLTEAYLDDYGLSQRSADARMRAEAEGLQVNGQPAMYLPDGSNRLVPVKSYYQSIGGSKNPINYIYSGTNFRLREISMGYTVRNLFRQGYSLSVSLIARNLFFLYKDCPTDPDVSLSTQNGLGAFEMFNMPPSRSYGLSLKLNF